MNEPGEPLNAERGTQEQSPLDVVRQTPPAVFRPGDPVPNLEMWILERRLGGGGFGEVWLARHERKGEAAVKFCTDPAARHKLVTHEKAIVARVMKHGGNHPNIVPLLECNLSGDIPWLMYEYVEGGTLAEAVAEWRDLPPPRRLGRAVRTLHAITSALGKFHRFDPPLIHRDLKPQNILMAGNTPRITDFGIGGAALEATNNSKPDDGSGLAVAVPIMLQTAGSSQYSPPEQFLGGAPNPRDDVFALGVIAYQLVLADLKAIPGFDVARELRSLRIPTELTTLIVRSVALDPDHRPKDAVEWETQLAALMKRKTVSNEPQPVPDESANDDPTEPMAALSESEISSAAASQTIDFKARGRWYSRPAGQPDAEWKLIATTPATVRVKPGEVYRFSIHSAATAQDLNAIRVLSGLSSLRYLNLSYGVAVTDATLATLKDYPGLRQLFLRGCVNITDAGLAYLQKLTALLSLELKDCNQLSETAITALRKALPQCKVLE
jgi:serine/threonine protein kinase